MSGNEFYETQFYYFNQVRDFVFDEDRLDSYNNKIFKEQKYGSVDAEVPEEDLKGFVKQVPNVYVQEEDNLDDEDNDFIFNRASYKPSQRKKQMDTFQKLYNIDNVPSIEAPKVEEPVVEEPQVEKPKITFKLK